MIIEPKHLAPLGILDPAKDRTRITVRLPLDLAEWVDGRGGSRYVRDLLEVERKRLTRLTRNPK